MILEEYIEKLQDILRENPESAGYEVVYAADEEGNRFSKVVYAPAVGHFRGMDFTASEEREETNAVCLN